MVTSDMGGNLGQFWKRNPGRVGVQGTTPPLTSGCEVDRAHHQRGERVARDNRMSGYLERMVETRIPLPIKPNTMRRTQRCVLGSPLLFSVASAEAEPRVVCRIEVVGSLSSVVDCNTLKPYQGFVSGHISA
jgi:hypothetical protein